MVSPSRDPPRTNPYISTLTTPTREPLPAAQYPYINQYYANMYNPNAMQAPSPYSTTTTTSSDTPTLYDRYRESGMMGSMGPILLSLICPKYQDLPSNSNPLFAIRLYVKPFCVAIHSSGWRAAISY